MLGFVRTVNGNADIIRLLVAQLSQFGSEFARDANARLPHRVPCSIDRRHFAVGVLANVNLSNGLIRKAVGHDEARVPGQQNQG